MQIVYNDQWSYIKPISLKQTDHIVVFVFAYFVLRFNVREMIENYNICLIFKEHFMLNKKGDFLEQYVVTDSRVISRVQGFHKG